jgi:hypothetical protein
MGLMIAIKHDNAVEHIGCIDTTHARDIVQTRKIRTTFTTQGSHA